jgi:hypothetical protein
VQIPPPGRFRFGLVRADESLTEVAGDARHEEPQIASRPFTRPVVRCAGLRGLDGSNTECRPRVHFLPTAPPWRGVAGQSGGACFGLSIRPKRSKPARCSRSARPASPCQTSWPFPPMRLRPRWPVPAPPATSHRRWPRPAASTGSRRRRSTLERSNWSCPPRPSRDRHGPRRISPHGPRIDRHGGSCGHALERVGNPLPACAQPAVPDAPRPIASVTLAVPV